MLRKVVVAALATGCYVQTADAFAAGGMAPLARGTPAFRTTSAARPRRAGLCTVNMGELRRARATEARKTQNMRPCVRARLHSCAYKCACVHASMRPCIRMHVYVHVRYMLVHMPPCVAATPSQRRRGGGDQAREPRRGRDAQGLVLARCLCTCRSCLHKGAHSSSRKPSCR
jgi:hypothetical protein